MTSDSQATCRLCGPAAFRPFALVNGFNLQRCKSCSLIQITDDLADIDLRDYYGRDFFDEVYSKIQAEGGGRSKEYQKFNFRMEEIEKLKPEKGNILDVGCSFGFFLDVARTRGWNPVGVEFGEFAAKFAQDSLELEVHVTDILDAPLKENCFDVITMWNVVEHVDDPVEVLKRLNALMKVGGLLILTTGDVDCYLRRVQGLRWRSFVPPIHIANYNVSAMNKLLKMTGFSLDVHTVALPWEALLKKLGVIGVFKWLEFSDKMMLFASKR